MLLQKGTALHWHTSSIDFTFRRDTDIRKRKTSHIGFISNVLLAMLCLSTIIVFGVDVGISTAFPLNGSVTHVLAECFRDTRHYKSQDAATKC